MYFEKFFQLFFNAKFSYSFTVAIFLDKLIISSILGGVFMLIFPELLSLFKS